MGVDSVLVRKDNASYESLADSQSVQAISTSNTHLKNHDETAKSSPHDSNPVSATITPTTTTTTASSTITSYDIIDHCSITPNQSMITESFLTEHSSDGSIQKQTENTSLNDSHVVTPNRFSCPEQGPACTSDTLATDDPHALSSTHRKFLSLIDPTTYKAINRFGQLCSFTLNLDWDSSDKQSALTEYDSESIPSSSKFSCDAFGHSSDVLSRTTENGEPEQTGSLYDSSSIDGSYGDVNRGSVEHQTTDDCSRITLADYLDSLNHGSTRKALKPIPQLAHVKKMSTIPNSASVVSDETENGPTADKLNHDTLTAPLSPLTNETNSESGINLPRPPSTSVDYLLKRRTFLLDRLAVRYTELLCLMNEELELTGHPPENYLQCINAYHEAQEAIRNLHPPTQDRDAKNSKPEIAEDASNNIDSRASISSRHRASNPGLPLPNALRGNRLQETGFLLSPKAFRKASLKVSPSVTSLLRGSRLSLNNEEDRDHCTDDGPIQKRPPLNQSMTNLRQRSKSSSKNTHLIADRTTVEDKRSWTKAKFARDIHTPRETVQEELPKCPRSKISLSMSELTSSSSTPSLRDFGNSGKPEGQRTSDPQDTGTMRRQSSQTSVYESEMKDLDEKDRSQAIAWIDMELSAVRNILEANQLCAKERCRTRESRKAYKLAARKNEETIARLERQKEALQSGMMTETEDSSVDSYATSTPDGSSRSVCSANPGSSQLTFDSIHSADDDKKPLSNGHVKTTISKHTGRASNCVCSIGRKKPPLQGMYDGLSRALGLHKPPSQDGDNSPGSHSRSVSPECPSAGKRIGDPVRCSRGKLPSPRSTPPPPEKQDERLNGADSNRNTLTNRTDTDLSSSVPQAASTPNRRHLVRPQCVGDPPLSGLAANSQYETSSDTGLGTSVAKSVNRDTDSDPGHWNNVSAGTKSVSSTELCEPSVRYVSPNPINHYWSAKPDANGCRVVRVPCQPRRSIPSSASAAALISVTQTSGQTAPNASVDSSENGLARIRRLSNQDKATTRSPTYPNYSTVQYRHSPTPENRSPQLPQITTLYATVLPRSSNNRSNSPAPMVKSPLVDQPCSNGASPLLSAMGTDRGLAFPSHYTHSRRIPSSESMDTFARGRIGSDPYYREERIYQTATKYGVRPGSRTPDPGAFSRRPVQIVTVGQSAFCGNSGTSSPSGSNYDAQSDAKILYPRNQNSLHGNHFGPTGDVYQSSSQSSGLACSSYWYVPRELESNDPANPVIDSTVNYFEKTLSTNYV